MHILWIICSCWTWQLFRDIGDVYIAIHYHFIILKYDSSAPSYKRSTKGNNSDSVIDEYLLAMFFQAVHILLRYYISSLKFVENIHWFLLITKPVRPTKYFNKLMFMPTSHSTHHRVTGEQRLKTTWYCTVMCSPMMTSSNRIILRVAGPLCGEFTGYLWIPPTKASEAELWCFLWSAPE